MTKIVVQLSGGLGNQMFQYAAGRGVAARRDAELVLDTWSGFVRDRQYRRRYELDALPIRGRPASALEKAPIWTNRLSARFSATKATSELIQLHRTILGDVIVERAHRFLPDLVARGQDRSCWLTGYWQSPKYFEHCADEVRAELTPPAPSDQRFLDLGETMRNSQSVALGIRLYEESKTPEAHARDGRVKTPAEINAAIAELHELLPDAHFYVFCTQRSPILESLDLPAAHTWLTHDDGYQGTLERLWLMTRCRHHIFTNSSYYWWGAWLGDFHLREGGYVFAADNFVNLDGLPVHWRTF